MSSSPALRCARAAGRSGSVGQTARWTSCFWRAHRTRFPVFLNLVWRFQPLNEVTTWPSFLVHLHRLPSSQPVQTRSLFEVTLRCHFTSHSLLCLLKVWEKTVRAFLWIDDCFFFFFLSEQTGEGIDEDFYERRDRCSCYITLLISGYSVHCTFHYSWKTLSHEQR